MSDHLISIVIINKDHKRSKNVECLINDIYAQEINIGKEILCITDISPLGKARNDGAAKARGDIFVFLDDDIRLGHLRVLKNIIGPVLNDEKIGICGASQLIGNDANWFQKRCAKEIHHMEHPVVQEIQEVGMVGGACCVVRKDIFLKIGKFNDKLLRGTDIEFCRRIKKQKYRIILAPRTWIIHPAPANFLELIKIGLRNGKAASFADKNYPDLIFDIGSDNIIHALEVKSKKYRMRRYIKNIVESSVFLKPINLLFKVSYAIGYFMGMLF